MSKNLRLYDVTKKDVIMKHQHHQKDTGSCEVQIAILTQKILELTEHLKANKHDFQCKLWLLKRVSQRQRLLLYLKNNNLKSYQKVVSDLALKK